MKRDFASEFLWPRQLPEIREALIGAFDSGQWGKYEGANAALLTEKLGQLLELKFVRLCSSGTIAVEIALAGVGVQPGDEVIVAAYDFPGNFRAIEKVGAVPVLADIDPATWCIDFHSIKQAFGSKTRAVIVSHLHGGIADIESIVAWAAENNVKILEDICQCPGATKNGQPLGTFGDVCALSFGGSKLLSAGRGGAIATGDESVWQRAKIYCERGNDAFPMSDLQSAVLLPQLERLNADAAQRRSRFALLTDRIGTNNALYNGTLNNTTLKTQKLSEESLPDFYKVPFLLPPEDSGQAKQDKIDSLRSQGIVIDHGFQGFANRSERRCRKPVSLDGAVNAASNTLVLHHPCLLSDSFDDILNELIKVL